MSVRQKKLIYPSLFTVVLMVAFATLQVGWAKAVRDESPTATDPAQGATNAGAEIPTRPEEVSGTKETNDVAIAPTPTVNREPMSETSQSAEGAAASNAQAAKETIGSELITITRLGFEPSEVIRPAGKFFLVMENRSNLNQVTFRLDNEKGQRIIEVAQPSDQLDWAGELNAKPGSYVLTIVERPEWVCHITITAQ